MTHPFTQEPWCKLENLSPQEIQMIFRYLRSPRTPSFLGVSEILRKQGFSKEAIVILEEGLKYFPKYHSARALLAKEYLNQGLIHESYELLQVVVEHSPDNLLARRLEIKLAALLNDRSRLTKALTAIKMIASDDPLTKAIRGCVTTEDWHQSRLIVRRHLIEMGIEIPEDIEKSIFPSRSQENVISSLSVETPEYDDQPWNIPPVSNTTSTYADLVSPISTRSTEISEDVKLPSVFQYGENLAHVRGEQDRYLALSGFARVPVEEAFQKTKQVQKTARFLEEKTLADLYLEQNEELKALNLYSKLVREYPNDSTIVSTYQHLLKKIQSKKEQTTPQKNKESISRDLKLKKLKFLLQQLS